MKIHDLKKIVFLGILLSCLFGILTYQFLNREEGVPAVKDDMEHAALSAVIEMIEVGRVRGWSKAEEFWSKPLTRQDRQALKYYFGNGFHTDFAFQGAAPVALDDVGKTVDPDKILIYGMFASGISVEILLERCEDKFKLVSIQEM